VLGGKLIHEESIAGRKHSAYVAIGEDSVVEIAQPLDAASAEARDLEKNGEGVHALTFKTRDLRKASEFLRDRKLRPTLDGGNGQVLDADQAFGMVIGFTERVIPNDPRQH
jgi:hypothetical protein